MSGFDLSKQAEQAQQEDQGIDVHIRGLDELPMFFQEKDDEDGTISEERPVTITVAGAHSHRFRRIEEKLRKRRLKPQHMTSERIFADNLEKAVACTLGWQGFHNDGEPLECNSENVRRVYNECPWVYEQVLEAMNDHSRFFESGSQSPQSI